jgi:hypothetical protein
LDLAFIILNFEEFWKRHITKIVRRKEINTNFVNVKGSIKKTDVNYSKRKHRGGKDSTAEETVRRRAREWISHKGRGATHITLRFKGRIA